MTGEDVNGERRFPPQNIPIPDPSILTTEQLQRIDITLRDHIREQIGCLEKLHDQKFESLNDLYSHIAESNKTALAAALLSQKETAAALTVAHNEAIAKSDAAVNNEIDALKTLIRTTDGATNTRIVDLTSRLDRGEGAARASTDTRTEKRADLSSTIAIAGFSATLISLARRAESGSPQSIWYRLPEYRERPPRGGTHDNRC
jgi:hypothetical protein